MMNHTKWYNILELISTGKLDELKLELPIELADSTFNGQTLPPIYWACHPGQTAEILKWLITECKVNVDQQDDAGISPLYAAIFHDQVDSVKLLLELGHAKVDPITHRGYTPLGAMCVGTETPNGKKIVKLLLSHGASFSKVKDPIPSWVRKIADSMGQ